MSTFRATSMHSEAAAAIGEAPEDGDPRPARADSDRTSARGTRVRKGKGVNSTDGSTAWPVRTPSQSTTVNGAQPNHPRRSFSSSVADPSRSSRSTSVFPRRNSPQARPNARASSGILLGPNRRRIAMMIKMMIHSIPMTCAARFHMASLPSPPTSPRFRRSWCPYQLFGFDTKKVPHGRCVTYSHSTHH